MAAKADYLDRYEQNITRLLELMADLTVDQEEVAAHGGASWFVEADVSGRSYTLADLVNTFANVQLFTDLIDRSKGGTEIARSNVLYQLKQ